MPDCTAVPQPILPCEAGAGDGYLSGACPHVGYVLNGSLVKKFTGATNAVELTDVAGLQTTANVSLSMWINPTDAHAGNATAIFGHYNDAAANGGTQYAGVTLYIHNNKIGFAVRKDLTNYVSRLTDAAATSVGEWHHIAAVWAPSTNPIIYVDGAVAASSATHVGTTPSSMTNPDIDALIGGGRAWNSDTSQYFQGYISNVAYYVKTLSSAEVLAEYQAGCPADIADSDLNGYWPLDGNFIDIATAGTSIGDGAQVGSVPDEIDVTRPVTQIKQEDLDISAVSATTALYYTIWQDPQFNAPGALNYGARLDEITLHYTAAGGGGGGAANIIIASDTLVSNVAFSTVSGNAVIIDSRSKVGVRILAMNSAFDCTLRKDTSGGDIISYVPAGNTKLRASIPVADGTDVYLDGDSNTTLTYCWTHSPIV